MRVRHIRRSSPRRAAVIGAALAAAAATVLSAGPAQAEPLTGTFSIGPGSYFRMILPTGTAAGPYLANVNSTAADKTLTPITGTLTTGVYQDQVSAPATFYGAPFTTSTKRVDPQTGSTTVPPSISRAGSTLSGDLDALGVAWNGQVFNQGAPKPGGGLPGKTAAPRGVIDANGDYTIEWTSQIVGGPFDNFTGLWHLTGHYRR